jgi:nucleoid DNA-binding protein
MDKPQTMSIKDWLIRNMSVEKGISEKVIEAVISHEMQGAREALDTCNSIEFSGWGKMMFNMRKAKKKCGKTRAIVSIIENTLAKGELSAQRRITHHIKLEQMTATIKYLTNRIDKYENQHQSINRGLEKSSFSTGEVEDDNLQCEQKEEKNL